MHTYIQVPFTSLHNKSSADEREGHAHHERTSPVQRRCQASGRVVFLRGSELGPRVVTRQGVRAFRPAARFLDEAQRVLDEFFVLHAVFAAGDQAAGHGRRRGARVVHVDVVTFEALLPLIFLLDGGHVHALAAVAIPLKVARSGKSKEPTEVA